MRLASAIVVSISASFVLTSFVLTSFVLTSTTSLQAEEAVSVQASQGNETGEQPSWTLFADRTAYQLHAWKLSASEQLIHGVFYESDAQMGIAIAAEVALLCEDAGYAFFQLNHKPGGVKVGKAKDYEPILKKLPKHDEQGVRFTQAFAVKFFKTKPNPSGDERAGGQVMEAAVFAQISRMARSENRESKKSAESKD